MPAPRPADSTDAASRSRGRLMAQSLVRLLDRVRGAREVLPHLAAVERSLAARGSDAIRLIPPHWLPKIYSQLSSLPIPEGDPPLHDLLDHLLQALRRHQAPAAAVDTFDAERTLVIREITHSAYDAAAAEMATTQSGQA